jgi:uncharacterized protein (TIGR00730 family)
MNDFYNGTLKSVCVYCGASNAVDGQYLNLAYELGKALSPSFNVIYGGGSDGLMGKLSQAVIDSHGTIIGVIPKKLIKVEHANMKVSKLIPVESMRERKHIMENFADAFVALPGGIGTLEEILEVITTKELKFHDKPSILCNYNGFFDGLIEFFQTLQQKNFLRNPLDSLFFTTNTVEETLALLKDIL